MKAPSSFHGTRGKRSCRERASRPDLTTSQRGALLLWCIRFTKFGRCSCCLSVAVCFARVARSKGFLPTRPESHFCKARCCCSRAVPLEQARDLTCSFWQQHALNS
ncbi:unnamed protein product, partial [Ectocarpus sp. 12 AP-2014]